MIDVRPFGAFSSCYAEWHFSEFQYAARRLTKCRAQFNAIERGAGEAFIRGNGSQSSQKSTSIKL
jgi:hypothetical protein